jgi:hypothetical protein
MVIVYFMLVLKFDRVKGNKREISISKIKNRIMIKKNCIENEGMLCVWVKKPHSNVFHFFNLVSDKTVIDLINVNIKMINKKFVVIATITVISF